MSGIHRSAAGVNLAYGCRYYHFPDRSRSDIREALKTDAVIDGEYALISQYGENVEATLSHTKGIPLGFAIKNHYSNERNLIWCERIESDRNECLVVVIRDGVVVLDAMISGAKIDDSLRTVIAVANSPFTVKTFGDVPFDYEGDLQFDPEGEVFTLSNEMVGTFDVLDKSILDELVVSDEANLEKINTALSTAGLVNKTPKFLLIAGILIVALVYIFLPAKQESELRSALTIDPYKNYKKELASKPVSSVVIQQLYSEFLKAKLVIGWQLETVVYEHQKFTMTFTNRDRSNLTIAVAELRARGYEIDVGTGKLAASIALKSPRFLPKNDIFLFTDSMTRVHDDVMKLNGAGIVVSGVDKKSNYTKSTIKLQLTSPSTATWKYLEASFSKLPIMMGSAGIIIDGSSETVNFEFTLIGQ
jgi:hypothetical protein